MEDRAARPRGRPGRGPASPVSDADPPRRALAWQDPRPSPIGSFLFLGPTGVGKTELTKSPGRVPVRSRRGSHHPHRHVRVHGEALRQPPDRRAAGLCRLRRRRLR
ncbi:hypothetical protein ACTMU2_02205 [Cupriavidus basilensis]